MNSSSTESTIKQLKRGVVNLVNEEELLDKLNQNKPLQVKLGADPSAPDIHLGHVVVLKKLRQFQDLGHQITFLIGDFTGMIGDPTAKSKTRPILTREEVLKNAQTYEKQIYKVLDPSKTIIRFNSEWSMKMKFTDVLNLTSKYTLARLLERDDFSNRYQKGEPISLSELLYPLIQGYDSVMLKADIELGGTDQLFNLLVGRELQKQFGQARQIVMTLPLLEGTDGKNKMSKSLGNYIALQDPPREMLGKVMSIPDDLIVRYFTLLTDLSEDEIKTIDQEIKRGSNPRNFKMQLATQIVAQFYDSTTATKSKEEFERIFQNKKGVPDDIPELRCDLQSIWIVDLIYQTNQFKSKGEIRRLIRSGAIEYDGSIIKDEHLNLKPKSGMIVRVGKKHFYQIASNSS